MRTDGSSDGRKQKLAVNAQKTYPLAAKRSRESRMSSQSLISLGDPRGERFDEVETSTLNHG